MIFYLLMSLSAVYMYLKIQRNIHMKILLLNKYIHRDATKLNLLKRINIKYLLLS